MKLIVNIHCLGGFREVGRNGVLVESSKNVLLDYGLKVENAGKPKHPNREVDALFVAHGHLDHLGLAPAIYRQYKCPVYVTGPTLDLSNLLLRDSLKIAKLKGMPRHYSATDIVNLHKGEKRIHYGDEIKVGRKVKVDVWDAGHMPGSCMFVVKTRGKKILYTSDFKIKSTRLVNGARFDAKNIDVVLMETTYSSRNHPPRKKTEKELFQDVKNTIDKGGIALLPSFAIRAPELLMVLNDFGADFPVYLDGMAKSATDIFLRHPKFLRKPKALKAATEKVIPLFSQEERNNALKEPCAIVTTGGCMEGGPIIHYIKKLYSDSNSSLIMTGFQIPGTAGRYLVDTNRFVHDNMDLKLKMRMSQYDMSAHAGRDELIKFVKKINPKKVLCMHGEYCKKFATELNSRFELDAMAPKNGDVIKI
ncbi:MBL fold metallo-hydrolase [Candidatus Woesearchaeota archaeon]|nr:MBL fold metallo-hydrolase [Candidatus Woesearchaeota archaeon]